MEPLTNCRFCNSTNIVTNRLIKSPHFKVSYQLYHCKSCNSKFFNPNEHQVSLDEMYQQFSKKQKENILTEEFKSDKVWLYQKKIITRFNKNLYSILDVGCRTGNFLMHFDSSIQREGVELSKDYCEVCNKRGLISYCDFVENISFKKKYSVVTSYALLEHIVDPIPLINQLKNLVEKDGLLVIMVPWHECLKEKALSFFNYRWHMYSPPEHFNLFSKKVLNDVVQSNNEFKLVYSYSSSGGNFNPFKKVPVLNKAFGYFMFQLDKTFINKLSIFDHLYLYYKRIN